MKYNYKVTAKQDKDMLGGAIDFTEVLVKSDKGVMAEYQVRKAPTGGVEVWYYGCNIVYTSETVLDAVTNGIIAEWEK